MRRSLPWLLTIGLLAAPALAQEAPSAKSSTDFKPYTETITGTDITFDMVPIPGGTFTMGSPDDEEGRLEDEGPTRKVKVGPFWMGQHEVTWDEFDEFAFSFDLKRKKREGIDLAAQTVLEKLADAVTRPTPPYADETFGLGRKGQPALGMTHHAAMEYCRWLSQKTGKAYRLPTEAEWEYACRAGTQTAYSFGADATEIDEYAWYVENAPKPMKVGKKAPNAFGLHDMHGNIAEWCLDHYVEDLYSTWPADQVVDRPVVLPTDQEYPYVIRGGSWDDDPEMLRSATRRSSDPELSMQDPNRPQSIWWHTDATTIGFRIVRALDEQENLKGIKSLVVKKKGAK